MTELVTEEAKCRSKREALANKYEILQSKRRGEPPYSSILTDRQTDNGRTCKYRDPKK